jgi:hypothetical protein
MSSCGKPMSCPDYPQFCRSPGASQRSLTDGEQALITGAAAPFAKPASRCSYCGLVYVPFPPPPRRLGWLNNDISGDGFKPTKGYEG